MKPKLAETLGAIIVAAVGGIFLFVGLFLSISGTNFQKNAIETTGVISKIESYRDSEGETSHQAYVKYTVNGEEYNQASNYYSASMYEGKEITIYYDPQMPTKIQVQGESGFTFIFVVIGGIAVLIGIGMIVNKMKKSSDGKKLMETGEKVYAEIIDVAENWSYSVNGRHPYLITCNWNGPEGILEFKSQNIWEDPRPIIEANGITVMAVYFDRLNTKKYFMSLEELTDMGYSID